MEAQVHIERAEIAEPCGHFVKTHFVNDVFQCVDLMRHQCHAPFPIVEAICSLDKNPSLARSVKSISDAIDYLKQTLNPAPKKDTPLNPLESLFAGIEVERTK